MRGRRKVIIFHRGQRSEVKDFILTMSVFGLIMGAALDLRAQDPAATIDFAPQNLSAGEVQRMDQKREIDTRIQRIRELYARGQYDRALEEARSAAAIDSNNYTVKLYERWAEEKLIAAQAAEESPEQMTRFGSQVPPLPPPGVPISQPAIVAPEPQPPAPDVQSATTAAPGADSAPAAAADTEAPNSRLFLIAAAILGVLVAIGAGLSRFISRRKTAEIEPEAEEEESEIFEPQGLASADFVSERPMSEEEELAANIALKMGASEPESEAPPEFDIDFPVDADGESHENQATIFDPNAGRDDMQEENSELEWKPEGLQISEPEIAESPQPEPKQAEPDKDFLDTVSFDDLGIVIPPDSEKASQKSEPANPAVAEPSPEPRPNKSAAAKDQPIQLDFGPVTPEPDEEPAAEKRPADTRPPIRLNDVAPKPPSAKQDSDAAPQNHEKPSASPEDAMGETATINFPGKSKSQQTTDEEQSDGSSSVTFSNLDTLRISPVSDQPDSDEQDVMQETKTVPSPVVVDEDLRQTKTMAPGNGSGTATPPALQDVDSTETIAPGRLDARSERIFKEQLRQGTEAFDAGNWKRAVHYLSIASALHPENQEVRDKLREARELKRQQEVGT